jgi:acetone carboxylase gamma subunit
MKPAKSIKLVQKQVDFFEDVLVCVGDELLVVEMAIDEELRYF